MKSRSITKKREWHRPDKTTGKGTADKDTRADKFSVMESSLTVAALWETSLVTVVQK